MNSQPATLWNKNFILLWLGSAQTRMGTALYIVALSYLVLELTGSPKYTAYAIAVTAIPYLFSPLAGALVDRVDTKKYLVMGDLLRGLGMVSLSLLGWSHLLSISAILWISFFLGLIGVIYMPAFGSLLPRLVPSSEVGRANALNNMNAEIATLLGFTIGGILVNGLGTLTSILINGITFFIMAICMGSIRFPHRPRNRQKSTSIWEDIRQGLIYLFSSKMLLMVPIIFGLSMIAYSPLEALMPIKMKSLHAGSKEFGIYFACITLGSLVISSYISKFGKSLDPRRYTSIGLFIMGISIVATTMAPHLSMVYISAMSFGMGSSLVGISNMSYVQTKVNDEYRGRVFGAFGLIERLGMPLSLALIGFLIDHVSMSEIFYGLAMVLFITLILWRIVSHPTRHDPADELPNRL
ncbi:MFS transporter [Marininema halotolerans]|uniref:MFS transporter, DHA3 family, macrolide efflux protein n=1 Tax=Marininema halotolerans TaxID=1155944 RepID=A0A1I6QN13_9BACL|nr:MFS transporter [Marininema halotolerans]SFS53831.1 MFS transporter, DHA3 family, macrolide efflux protein [Marininema halotolerans]